jgi:DNA invertase Pin-like site-specific DNA recombinase
MSTINYFGDNLVMLTKGSVAQVIEKSTHYYKNGKILPLTKHVAAKFLSQEKAMSKKAYKVLAFAFGLSAEIERNLISQRTKEALARKKAEGVILGRPKGRKSTKYKLTGKEEMIVLLLKKGKSKTYTFITTNEFDINFVLSLNIIILVSNSASSFITT